MNSLTISGIIFACIFGGALAGVILRGALPDHHLSPDSRDVVKLGMGLIGTMTALVLGLLIASAKSSFDTQRNGVAQLAANVIVVDRDLAHYGPEAKDSREMLRASVADMIERTWPDENGQPQSHGQPSGTEGRYEGLYDKIQELAPKTEAQRTFQAQALKTAADTAQMRWLLFAQKGSSIPTPFLAVMVAWVALILASFGLFAPRNAIAMVTLLLCSLTIASAIFLILELDRPFGGIIQISSGPLRNALAQLGR
jgi:Protein of unknown function (DUF4239)